MHSFDIFVWDLMPTVCAAVLRGYSMQGENFKTILDWFPMRAIYNMAKLIGGAAARYF